MFFICPSVVLGPCKDHARLLWLLGGKSWGEQGAHPDSGCSSSSRQPSRAARPVLPESVVHPRFARTCADLESGLAVDRRAGAIRRVPDTTSCVPLRQTPGCCDQVPRLAGAATGGAMPSAAGLPSRSRDPGPRAVPLSSVQWLKRHTSASPGCRRDFGGKKRAV